MLPANLVFLAGTRPEVLKLAPVVAACRARPSELRTVFGLVHQQQSVLERALSDCGLAGDFHVPLRTLPSPDYLSRVEAEMRGRLQTALAEAAPDWVLVQGDTTTAVAGALAARDLGLPCAHVEAGLRTGDLRDPFPEEPNRCRIADAACLHFAPTERARANLVAEGVDPASVVLAGNTGIDALRRALGSLEESARERRRPHRDGVRELLVTAHRRENHGEGVRRISRALLEVLERRADVRVHFVLHPHPGAYEIPMRLLGPHPRVALHPPMHHADFLGLMERATLVLSDSGGVQEELPYLGRPLLVLREKTERPESLDAGVARLVGSNARRIADGVLELLEDDVLRARMSRVTHLYGDGHAAERIRDDLLRRTSAEGEEIGPTSAAGERRRRVTGS